MKALSPAQCGGSPERVLGLFNEISTGKGISLGHNTIQSYEIHKTKRDVKGMVQCRRTA